MAKVLLAFLMFVSACGVTRQGSVGGEGGDGGEGGEPVQTCRVCKCDEGCPELKSKSCVVCE